VLKDIGSLNKQREKLINICPFFFFQPENILTPCDCDPSWLHQVDQDIYLVDAETLCISGDADNSGSIDISDVMYLIDYLFKGGSEPEPMFAGDSNNDNKVSISDVVYLINYLLKGGQKPSCQ